MGSGYPGFVCETGCMRNDQHRNRFPVTFLMFQRVRMRGILKAMGTAAVVKRPHRWDRTMRRGHISALGSHDASGWRQCVGIS